MFTNYGAQSAIFNIGSAINDRYISAIEVGTGSGTVAVTNVTLVAGSLRSMITGSPNFATNLKVGFQGDFNSVQMSGIQLTEIGLFTSGTVLIGSAWGREYFNSVTFDGTNELQLTWTIEAVPG